MIRQQPMQYRPGSTIVEVLVVIAIVGVLLALTTTAFVTAGIRFANRLEAQANWAKKVVRRPQATLADSRGRLIGDQYIVILEEGVEPDDEILRLSPYVPLRVLYTFRHSFKGFAAQLPASYIPMLLGEPTVRYVEQDQTLTLANVLSESEGELTSTGLRRINALATAPALVDADIAIIDTGVDLANRDLNVVVRKGFNCSDDAKDTDGHGTQVASIAAAKANKIGVLGAAPGARVWALKVASDNNSGAASNLIAALDFVISRADEIDVANVSVCTTRQSVAVNLAAANCVRAGVVVVAAAGNGKRDASSFSPASEPSVLTVAALADTDGKLGGKGEKSSAGDADDTVASFSNVGPLVDLLAPGVQVDTVDLANQRSKATGTSFAAAHVSGLAALLCDGRLARRSGSLTPEAVAAHLLGTVRERIPGRGRLNPYPVLNHGSAATATASPSGFTAPVKLPMTLPLSFEANHGQAHADVQFLSRAKDYNVLLTGKGMVLSRKKMPTQRILFANANPNAFAVGKAPLPGVANYWLCANLVESGVDDVYLHRGLGGQLFHLHSRMDSALWQSNRWRFGPACCSCRNMS